MIFPSALTSSTWIACACQRMLTLKSRSFSSKNTTLCLQAMVNESKHQLGFQCWRRSNLYLRERPREKRMRSTSPFVGSLLRCTCADSCCNPLLFKPLLTPTGNAANPGKWCWRWTWKARRAELEVLARRGEEKTKRSRRVPCIHDTTLKRGWLSDAPRRASPTSRLRCCSEPR